MFSRSTFAATLFSLLASSVLPAHAQTVSLPVNNASFENPATSTFTTSIPGWTGIVDAGVHSFAFVANQFQDNAAPDGSQFGYINSGSINQDANETITVGHTYTFTGSIGRRFDSPNAIGSASLSTTAGTVLASTGSITAPLGTFTSFSVSFTAMESDPFLGQGLRLQLNNVSQTDQVDFDKIALTRTPVVSTPAPSSLLTLLIGAVPFAAIKLRRRR